MAQQPDTNEADLVLPALKIEEQDPDPKNPWGDDVLDRKEIADRLTSIVRGQEASFVISLDGRWGTGKTFLLRRWAQDLRNQDPPWQAIYFNAWEDDFNDDPLLAIIGQLSEYFDEGPLREIARGVAGALGHVLVKRVTGASPDDLTPDSLLNDYREGLRTKSAVKDRLEQLGAKVRDDTGQPLVFIIDELDRCRPTFAIELLERVKHIFDVPNIVFVFGINRAELTKALVSVYGEIEAGEYLRRFFDMEFTLPEPEPPRFCEYLVTRYGLDTFLANQRDRDSRNPPEVAHVVSFTLGAMRLSLRDMDYCMRLLALASRDSEAELAPALELFVTLVALRIANQGLYRDFVGGVARGADVINYINTRRQSDDASASAEGYLEGPDIERLEAALYAADEGADPQGQINSLLDGRSVSRPESLAPHHRSQVSLDPFGERPKLEQLRNRISSFSDRNPHRVLVQLARTIDLYHGSVRR